VYYTGAYANVDNSGIAQMRGDAIGKTYGDLEGFYKWISNFFFFSEFISFSFIGFEEL